VRQRAKIARYRKLEFGPTKNFLKLFSPQTSAARESRRVKNGELEKFAEGQFGIIAMSPQFWPTCSYTS
jgi:hypothetical protein